jgi:CRISPR-associated protein Cas2
MRVLVFFDLPQTTIAERRAYRRFRKGLIRNGFIMMQESVYCKLALNNTAQESIMRTVRALKPEHGLIQMMAITEKQFQKIECVLGNVVADTLDSTDRLVVL